MLILPSPDTAGIYYVFHKRIEFWPTNAELATPVLYKTVINMKFLGGLGKVVYKNKPVMEDTLAPSELTAVRHANGKDWWIITPQYQKPAYYVFLFTKDGIVDTLEQTIGVPYDIGGWQCIFSPDGAKFVRYGIYDDISIFDFDRATGQLSNFKFIPLEEETYQGNPPVNPGMRHFSQFPFFIHRRTVCHLPVRSLGRRHRSLQTTHRRLRRLLFPVCYDIQYHAVGPRL
jgi:hypothetical protein